MDDGGCGRTAEEDGRFSMLLVCSCRVGITGARRRQWFLCGRSIFCLQTLEIGWLGGNFDCGRSFDFEADLTGWRGLRAALIGEVTGVLEVAGGGADAVSGSSFDW
ncbi:diguanylate cyclase domain-containing protein [Striga asiatica]|uniref:Diguanylate cyclase domain-containing protein n=1 Tax=Striga asiatica TaxID=4170 RepID=A0A5A7Q103_STRAF|nr:diguanylate cyclase domain-containing protein [Striga asiatica]